MTDDDTLPQGTPPWFEMVGAMMCDAATLADLPPDLDVSLVERYSDGTEAAPGLVQGIRFDIVGGRPSFRVGVGREERADVVVEVTAAAARRLNRLLSSDPAYGRERQAFMDSGAMRVKGDPARLGDWLEAVHDPIVKRTR